MDFLSLSATPPFGSAVGEAAPGIAGSGAFALALSSGIAASAWTLASGLLGGDLETNLIMAAILALLISASGSSFFLSAFES